MGVASRFDSEAILVRRALPPRSLQGRCRRSGFKEQRASGNEALSNDETEGAWGSTKRGGLLRSLLAGASTLRQVLLLDLSPLSGEVDLVRGVRIPGSPIETQCEVEGVRIGPVGPEADRSKVSLGVREDIRNKSAADTASPIGR
jgi:hypothetical protein